MQVKEVENENLKRSYEVIISADEINTEIDSKLNELSKTLKIPGFRPGKVPMNVVKQRHGEAVLGEVLEQIVGKTSQDLIKEKDIRPAVQPKIEVKSFENGGDLVYSVTLEIFSEVLRFLKKKSINSLCVKQIPTIYNFNFNDELDYLSFVTDSKNYRKDIISVINLQSDFKIAKDRINAHLKKFTPGNL